MSHQWRPDDRARNAERVRAAIKAGLPLSEAIMAWTGESTRVVVLDSIRDVLGCSLVWWEQQPRTADQILALFEAALSLDRAAMYASRQKRTTKKSVAVREQGIGISGYLQPMEGA